MKNKITCPEETIFQTGKEGEHISGEQLFLIADSFMKRFDGMSRGRNNNRKMTFDLICRNLLFDICRQYGLEIEEVPEYGGKKYLEKQEFIIQAQKEKIVRQEQMIKEQEEKIMDNETLIDEVSEIAYDKAVEVVTEKVRAQTQEEDIRLLD